MHIQDINTLSTEQLSDVIKQIRTGSQNKFQFRHKIANGEIRDVEVFSGLITIGNEKVLYSIVNDISERKKFFRIPY